MKHPFILTTLLSSFAVIPGFAQSDPADTIKSKNLDEVVVEARQQSTSAKVSALPKYCTCISTPTSGRPYQTASQSPGSNP